MFKEGKRRGVGERLEGRQGTLGWVSEYLHPAPLLVRVLFLPPLVGWLEFNVPFQHKYGYIRDEFHRRYFV